MIEYSKKAQKDLNSEGIFDENNDRLGYAGRRPEMYPAIFFGMGGEPVTKNDDNLPELNINNERTYTLIDKMLDWYYSLS